MILAKTAMHAISFRMRREVTYVLTNLPYIATLTLIKYISNLVHYRGGTDDSANDINDIIDTRNGLLLICLLHRQFGTGKLSFLKVCCYFHPGLF